VYIVNAGLRVEFLFTVQFRLDFTLISLARLLRPCCT